MKCPGCDNDMVELTSFATVDSPALEMRLYNFNLCISGNNVCAGTMIKEDVLEKQLTFVTPSHSTKTLHKNFVESISSDELIKNIYSVYEWLAIQKIKEEAK